MSLERIRELISARTGLQPDSLGAGAVPAAVAARLRLQTGVRPEDYADRLARDPREFQALIDAIIVPETWFFRGGAIYNALVKSVRDRLAAGPTAVVRVLSLPCSTGEEPYSVAMAFTDGGLAAKSWSIDAIDLCAHSIAAAQLGRYREFSFRETPAEVRSRHFASVGEPFEIHPSLRDRIRFRVGNLLEPMTLNAGGSRFDIVLCRNLMIYLTPAARRAALGTLDQLLAPDGLLAIGHAEAGNLHGSQFESVGPEGCFLFRRKEFIEPKSELKPRPAPASGGVRTVMPLSQGGSPPLPPSLAKAKSFADTGRLNEALAECRRLLGLAPTADAYCLLGVILGATAEPERARDAFRKALYLDPHHRDALTHSALAAEAEPDPVRAGMYRARLDRLPAPEGNP